MIESKAEQELEDAISRHNLRLYILATKEQERKRQEKPQ